MCGRYGYTNADAEKIKKRFRLKEIKFELVPRYNIAPTQNVPVILNRALDELRPLRWGLVPFWAKDESIGQRMINARAETVTEKPAFRASIRKKRCLVIADCFYEWQKTDNGKQPFAIRMKSQEPFAFAGIWDNWEKDGKQLHTVSIITCEPNKMMSPIHNRMPVILPPDKEEAWLSDISLDDVKDLLKPLPEEGWETFPISRRVNSPANDSADVLIPE